MTHDDHVALIREAVTPGLWADFGSGDGAFTLALEDLGRDTVSIYSIDKDAHRLTVQKELFRERFPQAKINFLHRDFTDLSDLPSFDGVIMANSLHYLKDQVSFLQKLQEKIKPGGYLILVEYNVDSGNIWVPYPLSYKTFVLLMEQTGYTDPKRLKTIPSQFLKEIYSAYARTPQTGS